MSDSRTLWAWYLASGDEHRRYWAISAQGSLVPEFVVDSVEFRAPARTHRDEARSRGVIEVAGRLHVRRLGDRLEATITDETVAPAPSAPVDQVDVAGQVEACAVGMRSRRAQFEAMLRVPTTFASTPLLGVP